jgi:electron transfer flavoprotein alpha subunit
MMKILVYIQQDEGKINSVSLEALKGAQEIAAQTEATISALSFNSDITSQLAGYNVSEVLLAKDEKLNIFNPLLYLKALEDIAKAESPDIIVFGHTYEARDWAPRLSAHMDIPLISDCIGFKMEAKLNAIRNQGNIHVSA